MQSSPQTAEDRRDAAYTDAPSSHNIIQLHDAFIGRDDALDWIAAQLEAGERWITLSGPPGVGKSRLAREAALAAAHHGRWRELCWVDLRGAQTEGELERLLIEALRLPTEPSEPPAATRARLIETLHTRAPLLILDDADHLIGALRAIDDQLRERHGATNLQRIVTSRRPADAPGELVWQVAPLGCDASDGAAMALLRARLAEARVGRSWDKSAWEACARLASLLGGAPLAIEIAAARLRQLPPARLVERVERAILGEPTPLAALNAAVALSWELLEPWEQATLAQCAVCEPGFGAELIELCAPADRWPDAPATLDILEQLQHHALISFLDDGQLMRGDMTPTVRLYALERLREQGELVAARRRHHAACSRIARRAHDNASGDRFHPAISELIAELPNLRRAAADAQPALQPDLDPAAHIDLWLGLALALWRAGDLAALRAGMTALRGYMEQHDEPAVALDPATLWAAWGLCATLGAVGWERDTVTPLLERALRHAQTHEQQLTTRLALAQSCVGIAEQAAEAHMAEARVLLKRAPNLMAEAQLRFTEGDIALRHERLHESLVAMREAAQLASQANADHLRARALTSLSFSCQSLGMVEEATTALREARDIFEERGDLLAQCHALRLLAWYCVDEQRSEYARAANDELLALGQRHAIGWARGTALLLAGHLELDAGRFAPAALAYEQAIIALKRDEITPMIAATSLYLSLALEAQHEWERARARFDDAYALIDTLRSPWARAYLRCVRAVWAGRDHDLQLASRLMDEASAEQGGSDSPFHAPMFSLYTCALDTLRWEQAQRAGKARQESQCLRQLLERLGGFMHTARPMLGRSLELRVGLRHIQQRLPVWLRARMTLELEDPSAASLLLDDEVLAYRAPGQDAWVDMSKRPTPMRLLLTLATHHAAAPGQPMSADTLCEHVWPGERIMPEAATNRLYVTIAGLRREGLRDVILNVEGGYLIAPNLKLRAVT